MSVQKLDAKLFVDVYRDFDHDVELGIITTDSSQDFLLDHVRDIAIRYYGDKEANLIINALLLRLWLTGSMLRDQSEGLRDILAVNMTPVIKEMSSLDLEPYWECVFQKGEMDEKKYNLYLNIEYDKLIRVLYKKIGKNN